MTETLLLVTASHVCLRDQCRQGGGRGWSLGWRRTTPSLPLPRQTGSHGWDLVKGGCAVANTERAIRNIRKERQVLFCFIGLGHSTSETLIMCMCLLNIYVNLHWCSEQPTEP